MDHRVNEINEKVGGVTLSYSNRLSIQDKKLRELDAFVHKPNNFMTILKSETEKIDQRLMKKLSHLDESIQE